MNLDTLQRLHIPSHMLCIAAIALLAIFSSACQQKIVGKQGEAVKDPKGAVSVTVQSALLERPQVNSSKGPLVFDKVALAVKVKFTNDSKADFSYQPPHTTASGNSKQAPLLFLDPKTEDGKLTSPIKPVLLEGGLLASQVASSKALASGKSITDVFLFEAPAQDKVDLVLTIPPAMHGGKGYLRIKIPYKKNEVPAPELVDQGKPAAVGTVEVTATKSQIEYLQLKDTNQGKGYSKDPVFVVHAKIENKGDKPITYSPGHDLSSAPQNGVALQDNEGNWLGLRVRFGTDRSVEGQVSGKPSVEPGKSITDVFVFERPPNSIKGLTFSLPGNIVGQPDVARIKLPYTYSTPPDPKKVEEKKEEKPK